MSGGSEDLVRFWQARARESIEEARLLYDAGHYNTCLNRIYYACFYAVSALLLSQGLSSSKHSGVRSLFGRHFIHTGIINAEQGAFYNNLFNLRQQSDYGEFYRADPSMLPAWITQAEAFITTIDGYITPAHGREA